MFRATQLERCPRPKTHTHTHTHTTLLTVPGRAHLPPPGGGISHLRLVADEDVVLEAERHVADGEGERVALEDAHESGSGPRVVAARDRLPDDHLRVLKSTTRQSTNWSVHESIGQSTIQLDSRVPGQSEFSETDLHEE